MTGNTGGAASSGAHGPGTTSTPGGTHARVPDAHFERRYREHADPYDLEQRWYERRKRSLTLACLSRERYGRAFEPGCALGLLTELLAGRCDDLLAVDASATAARSAARRTAELPHVRVTTMAVPDDWPPGDFDLVVLSEIGYYLDRATLERLRDRAVASLAPGGELLAVHYRPAVPEHILDGDRVHEVLRAAAGLRPLLAHREELFVADAFART